MKQCPKKLLVVEDRTGHRLLIQDTLKSWAEENGSQIDSASSVSEALEKLTAASFDLILTDYCLPDRTAFELLADIKDRELRLPVLLMISGDDEDLGARALQVGFADYIVKSHDQFLKLSHMVETTYERYLLEDEKGRLREELATKNNELGSMSQHLADLSIKDELTGLYNHRFLQEKIAEEFSCAVRYHHFLSCLMIDLDHFKVINDSLGHPVGDQVLREFGQILFSYVRASDTVARYGGEEFVILLPHVGYEGAHMLAERIQNEVISHIFASLIRPLQLSISIGVAVYPDDAIDRRDKLLLYADRALYRAKGTGRNRICLYREMANEFNEQIPEPKIKNEKIFEFRQRLFDISEMAKQAYIEATKAFVNALEAKDRYTLGHAGRVAHDSAMIARQMNFGEDEVKIVEHAGLLHDIGKICIADEILLKPGALTYEEYEQMKLHPTLGYQIVRPIKFLTEEALIILHHHEWYNGEGYPHRLKGRAIPIGARIVAISDAYDTIRTAGSRYKRTLDCASAVRELIEHSGTQFDPEILVHFVEMLVKKGELSDQAYDRRKLKASLRSIAA